MTHFVIHNYLPKRRTRDALADKPTSELKFALGVGKAGLKIWNKRNPQYKKVVEGLKALEVELKRRGEKVENPLGDSRTMRDVKPSFDIWLSKVKQIAGSEYSDLAKYYSFKAAYEDDASPATAIKDARKWLNDTGDTKDYDDWSNDKIRQLYRSWTSGGQKSKEAIGELSDNSGKSEQEIKRILSSRDALGKIDQFGSLDYLTSMHHFSATAEWPDGKKTQLYLMAPSLEDAKKQYKAQTNAGGWPKITGIKQAQVKPEPR